MQPWLVLRPNSATVAIANNLEKAERYARSGRTTLRALPRIHSEAIEHWFIIDRVEDPTAPKPVILVDPANFPNAGAPGDSMAVARRVLEREPTARSAAVVSDPAAVAGAFEVGIGGSAKFTIGGHADTSAVPIRAGQVCALTAGRRVSAGVRRARRPHFTHRQKRCCAIRKP